MKDKKLTSPIAIALTIILMASAIAYLVAEVNANTRLKSSLNNQRLKNETMLSEKLALEKVIVKLETEAESITSKNKELHLILTSTNNELSKREEEIKQFQQTSTSLAGIKKEYQSLLKSKNELEEQHLQHTASIKQLNAANQDLTQAITALQQKNNTLLNELNQRRMISINDVRVESIKKNNKLTIHARQTKKLQVNLEVPVTAENLAFKITSPAGNELTTKDGTVASRIVAAYPAPSYVASRSGQSAGDVPYHEIEMTYTPTARMMPGVYKVDVLDNNMSIGSLQVRFR